MIVTHDISSVFAMMRHHLTSLILASCTAHLVSGRCLNTLQNPEVTVADSDHLLVNWTKSFEGCDSSKVNSTKVHIGREVVEEVIFEKKTARVKANPCLKHLHISVRLNYEGTAVWSFVSHYNNYNVVPKIETVYSGMLQRRVVDKTCVKKDGELSIPEIPDELKICVVSFDTLTKSSETTTKSTQFSFTIVDPQNENRRRIMKTEFKTYERCLLVNQGTEDSRDPGSKAESRTQYGNYEHQSQTSLIIGCSIVATLLVVIFVVSAFWICFKRQKEKNVTKQEFNVNYDTAGVDYEYGTTGEDYDYDTMDNEASMRRREVKSEVRMEVVDRNSVYGKPEEDWDGAVAVDKNPVYEK